MDYEAKKSKTMPSNAFWGLSHLKLYRVHLPLHKIGVKGRVLSRRHFHFGVAQQLGERENVSFGHDKV